MVPRGGPLPWMKEELALLVWYSQREYFMLLVTIPINMPSIWDTSRLVYIESLYLTLDFISPKNLQFVAELTHA